MKNIRPRSSITGFAALAVFALFALCILCVLLSGAGAYRRLVSGGQEGHARRTAAQYISTKVRQSERGERVSVEPFGETEALVLREDVDGAGYQTLVYCHGGWLMELYCAEDSGLAPEDGEQLLPLQGLDLELDGGLLRAALTDGSGGEESLTFALRGREGGGS